jgi:hypothetical protein
MTLSLCTSRQQYPGSTQSSGVLEISSWEFASIGTYGAVVSVGAASGGLFGEITQNA